MALNEAPRTPIAFVAGIPSLPTTRSRPASNICRTRSSGRSPKQIPRMASTSARVHVGSVPSKLAELVSAQAEAAIASHGSFNVAISGGSLPKLLESGLPPATDFSDWRVYLADERIVPFHDDDSNYREITSRFPNMNVRPIDPSLPAVQCASDYQKTILQGIGPEAIFDAVLLGLGPDGHTCSLFPGHQLLDVDDRLVAHIKDSPKPPPARVTLTFPALNRADCSIFVCTGSSKAPVVADILENPESRLPGALVRPEGNHPVVWLLDEAAASQLSQTTIS